MIAHVNKKMTQSFEPFLVQGEGFEPPKAEPDDLQSPVFDRFTNPAYLYICYQWSHLRDLNPRPHPYHGCALPLS